MYEGLNAHIQIARIHATEGPRFAELRARLSQEQSEHEAIVAAIAAGTLPKLEAAVRNHIERAHKSLSSALGANPVQSASAQRSANQRAKQNKR
jgi:GntR family transcriptional regulator, rspAB operon transcriptional repressor